MSLPGMVFLFLLFGTLSAPAWSIEVDVSEKLSRESLKRGAQLLQNGDFQKASEQFNNIPDLGGYLSTYKHWFLGQTDLELAKFDEVESEFGKVLQSQISDELKYQAQFFLAEAALRQRKYETAIKYLSVLERKWRRSHQYPEVLYRMVLADLRTHKTASACQRARKLYSRFPAHSSVLAWGPQLGEVKIEDIQLSCQASEKDFSERIKNLQRAGESEKAHSEILTQLGSAKESDRFNLDMILASFFIAEGSTNDALNLLIRYYPKQKSNFNFLMLLGKAAARCGEFQTAVGAYEQAGRLSPRGKKGREALYQAAYLSYQFQDYDGAVKKFEKFVKAYPRSGLSRDATWNLAWLQYLRGDFKGALARLTQIKARSNERIQYWTAITHLRLKEVSAAKDGLAAIVNKSPYGYYGLAAEARLQKIKDLHDESERVPASASSKASNDNEKVSEESESEDSILADEESDGEDEDSGDEQASEVTDPVIKTRIDTAKNLIELGLPELAKWELWEVERKTRKASYLRLLLDSYAKIGSFNRSASIAELKFGRERLNGGFKDSKDLWRAMFPLAHEKMVSKAASQFALPKELIWGIMRAESLYKPDVISPVGARGLMQLMPFTANNLAKLVGAPSVDPPELLKPEVNIPFGSQYLARLGQKFKQNVPLIAAAYNAGPHRVDGWLINFGHLDTDEFIEHIPFLETRNYVKKVLTNFTMYRRIYAGDQGSVTQLASSLGVPPPGRAPTRENWESP